MRDEPVMMNRIELPSEAPDRMGRFLSEMDVRNRIAREPAADSFTGLVERTTPNDELRFEAPPERRPLPQPPRTRAPARDFEGMTPDMGPMRVMKAARPSEGIRSPEPVVTSHPSGPDEPQDADLQPTIRKGGGPAFRTASGSVSQAGRDAAEAKGQTMPGGRYPIRNRTDLRNALNDYNRTGQPQSVKAWITQRAKALGETGMLPWTYEGAIAKAKSKERALERKGSPKTKAETRLEQQISKQTGKRYVGKR